MEGVLRYSPDVLCGEGVRHFCAGQAAGRLLQPGGVSGHDWVVDGEERWGLYKLNPVVTRSFESARFGFNPCAYKVISWFHQILLFQFATCTATERFSG
jgi:hypothetical protein